MRVPPIVLATIFCVAVSVLSCASTTQVTVNLTSPTNGSTVTSPVAVRASAVSTKKITGWRIYVDGTSVYYVKNTTSISANINMSAGSHRVTVRAWAGSSGNGSATSNITVANTSGTVAVSISPTSTSLNTGGTQQFVANVSGTTNTSVTWTASTGTISSSGAYTAPSTAGTATVKATSVADPTKYATATVSIAAPTTVGVSLSPTTAAVQVSNSQQFTAAVTGTTNNSVTWSVNGYTGGNSTVGTITTSGMYTAPTAVPSGGLVTVKATSAADTTKSASAAVTIAAGTTPVSISISPNTGSLQSGQTLQFTATVTGTTNTAANWLVNGTQGGNSTLGTISSNGLYKAPPCPSQGSVTITAKSVYDTSATSNAASVALSAAPAGTGGNYYVATNGSDSNNGSACNPWATISHAASALTLGTNGATVHVAPGTYNSCFVTSRSGTATQRIRYISDVQHGAHLICTAGGVSGQTTDATVWKDTSNGYIDIVGFDIDGQNVQGQTRVGIYLDQTSGSGGHNRVLGNKLHGMEGCSSNASSVGVTEYAGYMTSDVFDGNTVYDIGNTCGKQGFASGVSGDGIYVSNPYAVVTNNLIYNVGHVTSNTGVAVWMYHCGVGHETIANNTIFGNGNGIVWSWASGSGPTCQSGPNYMEISNNIAVNNLGWGIAENDYNCAHGGTCATNYGPYNYVENNLVHGNTGTGSGVGPSKGICSQVGDSGYNIVLFHSHCATNSVSVDPAAGSTFVNWQLNGSGDYHLLSGSPAIDKGENTGSNSFTTPKKDSFGGSRPYGAYPDMGYDEYGSSSANWPWY